MEKQRREAEIKHLEAEEKERQREREIRVLREKLMKMITAEAEQKVVMLSEFH